MRQRSARRDESPSNVKFTPVEHHTALFSSSASSDRPRIRGLILVAVRSASMVEPPMGRSTLSKQTIGSGSRPPSIAGSAFVNSSSPWYGRRDENRPVQRMDARWTSLVLAAPGVGESIMNIGIGPEIAGRTKGVIRQASATDRWAGFSKG